MLDTGLLRTRFQQRHAVDADAAVQLDFRRRLFRKNGAGPYSRATDLPGATFSRASLAYATTWKGDLKSFASDVFRNTDLSAPFEAQHTNIALQSQAFDNASWQKVNTAITANGATAPDGTATADVVTMTVDAPSQHLIGQDFGTRTGVHNVSCYVRSTGIRYFMLTDFTGSGWGAAMFDLQDGVVESVVLGSNAAITPAGPGWWRVSFDTANLASTTLYLGMDFRDLTSAYGLANLNRQAFVWGFQITAGPGVRTYIPTTTAAATRLADDLSLDLAPPAAFTILAESNVPAAAGSNQTLFDWNASGGPSANRVRAYFLNGQLVAEVVNASATVASSTPAAVTAGATIKAAFAMDGTGFKSCLNGGAVYSDPAAAIPAVNTLRIGRDNTGNGLNTRLHRLLIFNRAYTDLELQAITGAGA